MRYDNITRAVFLKRPNRFIAEVDIDGHTETVHVKNTGRCKELLVPGCEVWLTEPGTPDRKTKYDLVAVRKKSGVLFNIDSQAPNKVVKEWLSGQNYTKICPEYRYGDSRIDFYMERGDEKYLMEVKGCTLEIDGITEVRANVETHPEFGEALEDARISGVEVLFLTCHVEPDRIEITV